MRIGIVGLGFVGGTLQAAFGAARVPIKTHDIKFNSQLSEVASTDVCFICLPSPTEKGIQKLKPFYDTFNQLAELNYKGVLCLKSTLLPGTTESFAKEYPTLKFVHSPEFLKERTALQDFMSQKEILIGGDTVNCAIVAHAYSLAFSTLPLPKMKILPSSKTTELAKYFHNCFLATKVVFANEFAAVCTAHGVCWDDVRGAAVGQGVVGESHLSVPGPDSFPGYGGSCFPKDVNALLTHHDQLTVLSAARNANELLRKKP